MSNGLKKVSLLLLILGISFLISFYEFNGMYLSLTIPIMIAVVVYDSSYFVYSLIGSLISTFLIDYKFLPAIFISSMALTYIASFATRRLKNKISIKSYLAIIGAFFGFFVSVIQHFSLMNAPAINIILVPFICFFICYHIVEIQYELKSNERFSLTKKQAAFLVILVILLVSQWNITNIDFNIGFIIAMILNFILIKTDSLLGILACSASFIFNVQYDYDGAIFYLFPIIFAFRPLLINRNLGILSYFLINSLFCVYLKNYDYAIEFSFVTISILLLPNRVISIINKYILEPSDYELKLYQQSYYMCLNNNKKINRVMNMLQQQMNSNPKMKKTTRSIILQNLQFLSLKLNEEYDIKLKSKILDNLAYSNVEVLAFKFDFDYLNNYTINLEIKSNMIDEQKIIRILENHFAVRLKKEIFKYNRFIDSYTYVFVNDEKYTFNISIKQRSKDSSSCGDSYVAFSIKNKKYILISDGMGHGKKASRDSSNALFLLKNFIELGMDPRDAIGSCNALILDREKENFNTLDLLEYDIFENEIYLYKNGSGPTYLKNKGLVKRLNSENLPLGIVENINVEKIKLDSQYDYIVLTSDGLKKDLTEFIGNVKARNAKGISNEILEYEGENIDDDQTIVVINVIKKY